MSYIEELLNSAIGNRHIRALAVVVVAALLAKIVEWVLTKIVGRWARRTATQLDDQLLAALRKPIFYSVWLAGLMTALKIETLPGTLETVSFGLIRTLVVFIWLFLLMRLTTLIVSWMADHPTRFNAVQPATLPVFEIGIKVLLAGGAVYFILISWSINPTAWVASAGVIGIAVGFAAKDTLANLFAGVFILADAPYRVGNYIELDGRRGMVTKIGLRSTRILTRDDIEITIPNSTIANSQIINESGGPYVKHRLRLPVGVAYGSDIDQVRDVLMQVALSNDLICQDPEPRVRFRGFGDSSLNLELLCWIEDPKDRGRIQDSLNTNIYKALGQAGIEIPFPKRDVYIRQAPKQ